MLLSKPFDDAHMLAHAHFGTHEKEGRKEGRKVGTRARLMKGWAKFCCGFILR